MPIDLQHVVVINESRNPDRAGDVTLFKAIPDAQRYLEPIDVRNAEFYAYFLDGRELELSVLDDEVRIAPAPGEKHYSGRVRMLLENTAGAVLAARAKRRGAVESRPELSAMSARELIEIIGLS